jgi:hemolysin D
MSRHLNVLLSSWKAESARRKVDKAARSETDFLPAALEVMETPPSPIGRAIIWIIIGSAVVALGWSYFSKVDEVAVAEGRLVPRGRLRSVEASVQGVIRNIAVHEGEHVKAGDLLIELDPGQETADSVTAQVDLATAALTRARDNALLSYAAGTGGGFTPPPGANPTAIEAERQLVASRIQEYQAKAQSIEERRQGAQAAVLSTQAQIDKLKATLPLLKEQWDSQKELAAEGFGARQKLLATQQAYISAQQDLEAQIAHLSEAKSQVSSLMADKAQAREEFIGRAAQERAEAEGGVAEREQTLAKASERQARTRLVAPVSGTVQEVTVTTIGQSPEIGKPLVTLVADGEELVSEALLLNRDAGFVHEGQPVIIKLEAYPFTRYGTLKGVVEHVSPDATVDEHRGLVFPMRVRITQGDLRVNGTRAVLSPGMAATLEVVTGKRRVIDYLWSPVAKAMHEAGREN